MQLLRPAGQVGIQYSQVINLPVEGPPTLSTNTAVSSELTLLAETSTLSIRLYTLVSFLSILFLASAFILSFLACLMTQLALEWASLTFPFSLVSSAPAQFSLMEAPSNVLIFLTYSACSDY